MPDLPLHNPGYELAPCPAREAINLRGDPGDAEFLSRVAAVLGQDLPVGANSFSQARYTVCWLGPDEWLIMGDGLADCALPASLEETLTGMHSSVNVVSGGQRVLRLRGPGAREALAAGCTVDLAPASFRPGQCIQTALAKSGALILMLEDEPEFELVVRSSFGAYVERWLGTVGSGAG